MAKRIQGLLVVFAVVMLLAFLLKDQFAQWKIDYRVVAGANAILFALGIFSLFMHTRALESTNPNVFVRSVMIANVLKLIGLATAALIYISVAGKTTSSNAVFVALFLYIVYTWVEKRETIRMSKSRKS